MPSTRSIVVGLLVVVAVALGVAYSADRSTDAARTELVAAKALADAALRSDSASFRSAQSNRAVADSLRHELLLAEASIARAESSSKAARVRYVMVSGSAPDTCAPVIASADSALAAADSLVEELRSGLQVARSESVALRAASDTLTASNAALRASLTRLSASAGASIKASRPSFLQRITPKVGVGAAAGVDLHGRPNAVTGFTLSWVL